MRIKTLALAAFTLSSVPALADPFDWRDHQTASPREVARSWDRVQDERRDLARAYWRGDRDDVREEQRDLARAVREFREDRADLYRASWHDDDRHGWRGDRDDWRGDRDDWRGPRGRGWGPGGRPGNDWAWHRDGWGRPGWHAEYFYRPGPVYRPRVVGWNEPIWYGYDGRYYCRRSDGTTGLIIGGLTGGVLGNVLAPGGSKALGSILGGVAGAVIGNSIDRNRVICR